MSQMKSWEIWKIVERRKENNEEFGWYENLCRKNWKNILLCSKTLSYTLYWQGRLVWKNYFYARNTEYFVNRSSDLYFNF